MPELPEVEYVRRLLRRAMEGARIERVLLRRPNLRYPFTPDFVSRLEGENVLAVRRRAKYLLIDLASGDVLLMHLGMSGWFRVLPRRRSQSKEKADLSPSPRLRRPRKVRLYETAGASSKNLEKHDHVVFEMSNGRVVVFSDPRRFGFMTLHAPGELATHAALSTLGAEPLGRAFDAAALAKELGRRKTSLKVALLDQRVIAGLGNIYVSEALHRARLSPRRRASTLATKSGGPRPPARSRRRDRGGPEQGDQESAPDRLRRSVRRLRQGRRALPAPRLRRNDHTHRPGWTLDVLLSYVPALTIIVVRGVQL